MEKTHFRNGLCKRCQRSDRKDGFVWLFRPQKNLHPSAKLMENNLRTLGHAKMIVRLAQVTGIESDYWFPLTAQDKKILESYSVVVTEKSCHPSLTSNPTDEKGYFKS